MVNCILFISGKQTDISKFFRPIEEHTDLILNKTIEIKNNGCEQNTMKKGLDVPKDK